MKQKKVLGSVPRGLQWIEDIVEPAQQVEKVESAPLQGPSIKDSVATVQQTDVANMHSAAVSPSKSSQEGLSNGWTRATFIVQEEHLEKLKALAYWERVTIKEVVADALSLYLQNKVIDPINKSRKIT